MHHVGVRAAEIEADDRQIHRLLPFLAQTEFIGLEPGDVGGGMRTALVEEIAAGLAAVGSPDETDAFRSFRRVVPDHGDGGAVGRSLAGEQSAVKAWPSAEKELVSDFAHLERDFRLGHGDAEHALTEDERGGKGDKNQHRDGGGHHRFDHREAGSVACCGHVSLPCGECRNGTLRGGGCIVPQGRI